MAEGTQEKVWTHRRDKVPLLGRGEEKGQATAIENSLRRSLHMLATPPTPITEGRASCSTLPCGNQRSQAPG